MKSLSDPTRLRMLKLLSDHGTLCVCEVMQALNVSETRASRNLGILKDAGFLKSRRVGQWVHYSLDDSRAPFAQELGRLLSEYLSEDPGVKADRDRLRRSVKLGRVCSAKS
jgi:ArsR family transcriptional regulator